MDKDASKNSTREKNWIISLIDRQFSPFKKLTKEGKMKFILKPSTNLLYSRSKMKIISQHGNQQIQHLSTQ